MQDIIPKYGLLVLAAVGIVLWYWQPQMQIQLRYAHVICMILAIGNGRRMIQVQDIKGWFFQNVALLAHAGCLIFESIMTG